jgi:cytosine/adenosine deaminase-related metal-dependent hydrolase
MDHRLVGRARVVRLAPFVALLLAAAPAARAQDTVIAFTDVTVIPMTQEGAQRGFTVIVRGDRIVAVGPARRIRVPEGARRIDGRGKYLMPGVAEMHAHIPGSQNAAFQERVLFMYLAGGVTTIRGMLGQPQHLELRERAARREIWSPTIYTSGPSFNGNSAPSPEVARRMVEEQRRAGYDLLKIHPGLTRAVFDTLAATADRVGIRFAGHVPVDVALDRAIEARYASIDHLDGYVEWLAGAAPGTPSGFFGLDHIDRVDLARLPEIVRRTRAAGVWIVPTQTLFETMAGGESPLTMAGWPGHEYLPAQLVQQWVTSVRNFRTQNADQSRLERYLEVRRALIRQLHAGGVGLLLGSDAPQWMNPPGFSIARELASYVRAGLTPYQALETGTRNVARYFGAETEFGTVQVGRRADLILLDGNPLEDIAQFSRQAGVMVRGRWLGREEIAQRLAAYRQ